jgi:hypothetical protein
MAVSWDYFASLHGVSDMCLDVFLCPVLTKLFFESEKEIQAFLVCKAVEWSSQTIHTSRKRKIWI